jgi:uncharacterized repeat protein (TIGR01451 family)
VISGQQLTYTNTGGQTATGVTVRDPLPDSGVFVSLTATATVSASNVSSDTDDSATATTTVTES